MLHTLHASWCFSFNCHFLATVFLIKTLHDNGLMSCAECLAGIIGSMITKEVHFSDVTYLFSGAFKVSW